MDTFEGPSRTDWSFEYNAECAVRADELGFDLVFGLAQWLGKGGLGGEIRFRENTQDPLLVTAGLAALTKNIMLISTVHVLYGWHPLLLAKYAATLDHMTEGRWGINMVTGIKKEDFAMFGLEHVEHDLRYEMADEFVQVMKMLWTTDENIDFHGRFYNMEKVLFRQNQFTDDQSSSMPLRLVQGKDLPKSIRTSCLLLGQPARTFLQRLANVMN